jgi:formate dehydrogenase maturation protein FdhE
MRVQVRVEERLANPFHLLHQRIKRLLRSRAARLTAVAAAGLDCRADDLKVAAEVSEHRDLLLDLEQLND